MLWVVCYDIADDERRGAVCQVLLAYGDRVQYSVFECHLTAYARGRLRDELLPLIDTETDSLRLYPQCAWCEPGRITLGAALTTEDAGFELY